MSNAAVDVNAVLQARSSESRNGATRHLNCEPDFEQCKPEVAESRGRVSTGSYRIVGYIGSYFPATSTDFCTPDGISRHLLQIHTSLGQPARMNRAQEHFSCRPGGSLRKAMEEYAVIQESLVYDAHAAGARLSHDREALCAQEILPLVRKIHRKRPEISLPQPQRR